MARIGGLFSPKSPFCQLKRRKTSIKELKKIISKKLLGVCVSVSANVEEKAEKNICFVICSSGVISSLGDLSLSLSSVAPRLHRRRAQTESSTHSVPFQSTFSLNHPFFFRSNWFYDCVAREIVVVNPSEDFIIRCSLGVLLKESSLELFYDNSCRWSAVWATILPVQHWTVQLPGNSFAIPSFLQSLT